MKTEQSTETHDPAPVEVRGWIYQFKRRGDWLHMRRLCAESGISGDDDFHITCWPAHNRAFHIEQALRGLNVPANARKVALSLL